jgi:hypothetical protein
MGYGKPKPYAGKTKSAPGRKTNKTPRRRK